MKISYVVQGRKYLPRTGWASSNELPPPPPDMPGLAKFWSTITENTWRKFWYPLNDDSIRIRHNSSWYLALSPCVLVVGSFCELSKNFHHEGYDSYWEQLEFEICTITSTALLLNKIIKCKRNSMKKNVIVHE